MVCVKCHKRNAATFMVIFLVAVACVVKYAYTNREHFGLPSLV